MALTPAPKEAFGLSYRYYDEALQDYAYSTPLAGVWELPSAYYGANCMLVPMPVNGVAWWETYRPSQVQVTIPPTDAGVDSWWYPECSWGNTASGDSPYVFSRDSGEFLSDFPNMTCVSYYGGILITGLRFDPPIVFEVSSFWHEGGEASLLKGVQVSKEAYTVTLSQGSEGFLGAPAYCVDEPSPPPEVTPPLLAADPDVTMLYVNFGVTTLVTVWQDGMFIQSYFEGTRPKGWDS